MRRVERFPVEGPNSMRHWTKIVSPLKVMKNFAVIQMGRYCPSVELKRLLYKYGLGMKLEPDVSLALMAMVDIFFPEKITIGRNSIVGYNCTILTHEYMVREYGIGPVEIGAEVLIGANTTILPGVKIGDGAVVSACSLVNRDVEAGEVVGGIPIRKLKG